MKTLIPRRPGSVALGDVAFPAGVPILGATVNEGIPGPISGTYYSHYYLTIVRRWRRHVVNHDHIWRTEPMNSCRFHPLFSLCVDNGFDGGRRGEDNGRSLATGNLELVAQ